MAFAAGFLPAPLCSLQRPSLLLALIRLSQPPSKRHFWRSDFMVGLSFCCSIGAEDSGFTGAVGCRSSSWRFTTGHGTPSSQKTQTWRPSTMLVVMQRCPFSRHGRQNDSPTFWRSAWYLGPMRLLSPRSQNSKCGRFGLRTSSAPPDTADTGAASPSRCGSHRGRRRSRLRGWRRGRTQLQATCSFFRRVTSSCGALCSISKQP